MNPLQTNPQTYLNETITGVLVFAGVLFIGLGLIILFERMKRKDEAKEQEEANQREIDRLLMFDDTESFYHKSFHDHSS